MSKSLAGNCEAFLLLLLYHYYALYWYWRDWWM